MKELQHKRGGELIDILPMYISMFKNPKHWRNVSEAQWEKLMKWLNSGQSLKEYSVKHGKVVTTDGEDKKVIPEVEVIGNKNEPKLSVNQREIRLITDMRRSGKPVEQISKLLNIHEEIVRIIPTPSKKEIEPTETPKVSILNLIQLLKEERAILIHQIDAIESLLKLYAERGVK